jgi:hypothetical protein
VNSAVMFRTPSSSKREEIGHLRPVRPLVPIVRKNQKPRGSSRWI